MKKLIALVLALVCVLTLASCGKNDTYKIKIIVPAESTEEIVYQEDFVYSEEEISPTGNKITIYSGEGLGDTEVVLKPISVKEENAYEPTYIITIGSDGYFEGIGMSDEIKEELMELIVVGDLPTSEDNITDYFIKLREGTQQETP